MHRQPMPPLRCRRDLCAALMNMEALCAAPPEAPSLQVGSVEVVGVGHLRIVRHLLV